MACCIFACKDMHTMHAPHPLLKTPEPGAQQHWLSQEVPLLAMCVNIQHYSCTTTQGEPIPLTVLESYLPVPCSCKKKVWTGLASPGTIICLTGKTCWPMAFLCCASSQASELKAFPHPLRQSFL
eukprot:1157658-Pelagomonas_calceolata.AAC.4